MINISNNLKNALTSNARQLDGYYVFNGAQYKLLSVGLDWNSYSSDKDTFIGTFIARSGTIEIQPQDNINLENQWIKLYIGAKVNDVYEYTCLGDYCAYEKIGNKYQIADKRILWNTKADLSGITDKMSLTNLWLYIAFKMCALYPSHFTQDDFEELPINSDKMIQNPSFSEDSTYANIAESIAQCCGSFLFVSNGGKIKFRLFDEVDFSITLDKQRESFPSASEPYGPVNAVTLSNDDGNTTLKDETSIEQNGLTEVSFLYHPIMGSNKETFITELYNRLKGLSYIPMEVKSQGYWFLEPGDIVNVTMKDKSVKQLYIMNHHLRFSGGCSSAFEALALSSTQTECYPPPTNIENKVSKLEQNVSAESILTKISTALNDGNGSIETVEFKMDKDGFHIYQGGIDITNELGTVVFTVDEEGKLVLNNIVAQSGNIGGWDIAENGLIASQGRTETYIKPDGELRLSHYGSDGTATGKRVDKYCSIVPNEITLGTAGQIGLGNVAYLSNNGLRFNNLYKSLSVTLANENDSYSAYLDTNYGINVDGHFKIGGTSLVALEVINENSIIRLKETDCTYLNADSVTSDIYLLGNATFSMASSNTLDINVKNGSYNNSVQFVQNSSNDQAVLRPKITSKIQLGQASYKWSAVYATNTAIQSDRKHKKNVERIKKAFEFIMGLEPVQYLMKQGESGRTHYGFIAQDVNEWAKSLGENIALAKASHVTHDEEGNAIDNYYDGSTYVPDEELEWSLDYNEFIAPLVAVVQEQQKKIINLEERMKKLEKLLEGHYE